jgi:ribosomal RNA small subunit methyltransferase A
MKVFGINHNRVQIPPELRFTHRCNIKPRLHTKAYNDNDEDSSGPQLPAVGWLWSDSKTAAQTRQRLKEQNLRPKKALGQNFLLDDSILSSIVKSSGVGPGSNVLEIGPGTGNLTRHLLGTGALVTAVEKDTALYESLKVDFADHNIELIHGDVMRQKLPDIIDTMGHHWNNSTAGSNNNDNDDSQSLPPPVTVVANLPYNITKDLLMSWLPQGGHLHISKMVLMLQHEVGERLTMPTPGASDWRVINLIVQYYSDARYVFRVDRRKYHPAPKVDGAMVEFIFKKPEDRVKVPDEKGFIRLMKQAFSQKRKMMKNSIQPMVSGKDMGDALVACGMDESARAQDLSLQQFAQLSWELHNMKKDDKNNVDVDDNEIEKE